MRFPQGQSCGAQAAWIRPSPATPAPLWTCAGVRRTEQPSGRMTAGRDHCARAGGPASSEHTPSRCQQDRLFVLYTSPDPPVNRRGVHTTAGYNLWPAHLEWNVSDLREDDVHWCDADVGWITGHKLHIRPKGSLSAAPPPVMYEGAHGPRNRVRSEVTTKHKVSLFYNRSTAIRAFMESGREVPDHYEHGALRILDNGGGTDQPRKPGSGIGR